jgi:hypothetical protein
MNALLGKPGVAHAGMHVILGLYGEIPVISDDHNDL